MAVRPRLVGIPLRRQVVLPIFTKVGGGGAWTVDELTVSPTPTAADIIIFASGSDSNTSGQPTLTGFRFRQLTFRYSGTPGNILVWLGEPALGATSFGTTLDTNFTGSSFPGCCAIMYRLTDPDAQFRGRVAAETTGLTGSTNAAAVPAPTNIIDHGGLAIAAIRRDTGANGIGTVSGTGWDSELGGVLTGLACRPLSRSPNTLREAPGTVTFTTTSGATREHIYTSMVIQ